MSAALATSALPPGAYADDLAVVVVRRLEQGSRSESWGLFKTIVLGVPTFGLLPLVAWPARFREYVADESQAMQELAQWAKLRGREPAAVGPLLAAAEDTAAGPIPLVLSLLLTALVVGVFAIQFTHESFTLRHLLHLTYLRGSLDPAVVSSPRAQFIYRVWVIALSAGFVVQWLQARLHVANMERFVERFNPVAAAETLPPVQVPMHRRAVLTILWILTAVVLVRYGAWWGIPMVLAGMAQNRYTCLTGKLVRLELAKRVRDIVTLRQMPGTMLRAISHRCANERCKAPMRPQARFCNRCGSPNRETQS